MKQFKTISLNQVLIAVLTILALAMGQTAMAGNDWSVANPTGSKFRITRPDSHVGTTETVKYRTVNLSAYAGQHYTAVSGEVSFGSNDTYKEVTVTERTPDVDAYKYQTGDKRKYRFDVTDMGGFPLAHCDREITSGTNVVDTDVFNIKDVTIQASEYTADDRGYDNNGYKSVGASSFCTSGTQAYLGFLNAQLRMTLSFQAKENDDAFEYLQILFDNIKTCDNRSGASDGNPGTPSLSSYMAGFEMDTKKKDADYKSYTFPVTSVGDNASATNPWGHGEQWPLKNQKFKSGSRATDGRLIVPTDFSTLVLRLNASGGSGSDEWAARNVKAHIQAVDNTAPTKLAVSMAPGRHSHGNTFYMSVAFSEIVTISGDVKQLKTNWGDLNYVEGSGTNVLTFSGTIKTGALSSPQITGLTGSVQDLAGHDFTWSGQDTLLIDPNGDYIYSISYELNGGSVAKANPTSYHYTTATFTLDNPTKTGYTFAGWTGSNGNTASTSVTIAQFSHGNKSYTANWTANQYTVTLNNQNASTAGTTSVTATYDASMPAITVPTRTGYTFGGYYFGTNGGGTKYYNADGTSATAWIAAYDATLYAKWTANEYTVTLDMQGGDGGSTAATATYDAAMPAITVPTRTGYIFCGYYAETNGGGTQYYYADGTSAKNWDIADVTTLYAQWTNPTGTCGSSTTWDYNHATTTLSISGSGSTGDYNLDTQPWKDYREYITAVSISDDITHIGEGAFNRFTKLTSVSGGNGVTSIGSYAFNNTKWYSTAYQANAITYLGHVLVCGRGYNGGNVVVADGTTAIYEDAFNGNFAITSVTIPDGVISIGRQAFFNCSNLATVNVLGDTPPTLDSHAFDGYSNNSRTFNVRNASYKTTGRWADIYNKVNDYSGYDNFTLRVVSTLSLPDGVTVSVAEGDKVTILGTDYYVEGADVTLSGLGTEHTDGGVTYRSRATVSYNSDQTLTADADPSTGQAIFTMPAADASVTVADYPYAVKYIDADGTEQTCYNPTAIQSGDFQILGSTANDEAWYVVSGEVIANGCLEIKDKAVHLVLCDGATLSATSATDGINCRYGSLTIYTQSGGTGSLMAKSNTYRNGINVDGNLTINGGNINAAGGHFGIYASGTITLGWTHATDRIYASSYIGPVSVKNGQTLTDGTAAFTGTLSSEQFTAMAGKTLWPDLWDVAGGNDGSEEHPYTITTTGGLDQLAAQVNEGNDFKDKFFRLGNDITYSHKADNEEGADTENNYTTIGGYYNGSWKVFRGTFDGQGHTVSGIRIYKDGTTNADDYQGLFGRTSGATIRNVNLADACITGRQIVGGIAGYIAVNGVSGGIVENCHVGSDVTIHAVVNNASNHGGVVGRCNGGTIRGCVSAATLTKAYGLTDILYFGGIVGNNNGNMSDCLAIGASVPAVIFYSAIAGNDDESGITNTNCYYRDCTVGADTHQTDAYTVSAGTDVTLAPAGNADATYPYNGIQRYGDALYYNGVLYAPAAVEVSLTLGNTVTPAESFVGYHATTGTLSGSENPYTLTMTAKDATIIAKLKVPYIDENGDEQICSDYTLLQSIDNNITYGTDGETHWYVVKDTVDLDYCNLRFNDQNVHLILCDGSKLTGGCEVRSSGTSLTIYGQSQQSGEIESFIQCSSIWNDNGDITINGGTFNLSGQSRISAHGNLTMNGGTVNITDGSSIYGRNITINGGNVSVIVKLDKCIWASDTITLGWTNPTDRINVINEYKCKVLRVKDGQALANEYGNVFSGDITAENKDSRIDVRALRPALILADDADNSSAIAANNGFDLTLQLSGRTLYKDGYWNTLCLPFDVAIEGSPLDGADVRALASADLTGDVLTLNFTPETGEDAVTTIEAGKPYIIRWGTPESNPSTTLKDPVFMNVTVKSGMHNFTSEDEKVQFKGNYSPINWTEDTPSILFVGAENKLHWPLANAHLNAFRAYFELADGAQARSINLNFGEETTSIDHSPLTIDHSAGAWYDMQGRKVSGKPTTKGLYIYKGKKVVIK